MLTEPPAVEHFWARPASSPGQEEIAQGRRPAPRPAQAPAAPTELLALLQGLGYRQLTPELVEAYDTGD